MPPITITKNTQDLIEVAIHRDLFKESVGGNEIVNTQEAVEHSQHRGIYIYVTQDLIEYCVHHIIYIRNTGDPVEVAYIAAAPTPANYYTDRAMPPGTKFTW